MIPTMTESFVYVWANIENNMFYIGKHKGLDSDGYVSSGKYFLSVYNQDPKLFTRDIVFRGSDRDCILEESRRISEAIRNVGYDRIYNLTSFNKLSQWKRTCLACGAICCPENQRWAEAFEKIHFSNCHKAPIREDGYAEDSVIGLQKTKEEKMQKIKIDTRLKVTKKKKKVFPRKEKQLFEKIDKGPRPYIFFKPSQIKSMEKRLEIYKDKIRNNKGNDFDIIMVEQLQKSLDEDSYNRNLLMIDHKNLAITPLIDK